MGDEARDSDAAGSFRIFAVTFTLWEGTSTTMHPKADKMLMDDWVATWSIKSQRKNASGSFGEELSIAY